MKPVEFEYQIDVAAKNQPEYMPLPFLAFENDPRGEIISCWEFVSEEEKQEFIRTGKLYLSMWVFTNPETGERNPITPSMITPFIEDLVKFQ